jgi:alpha-amylase
MTLPVLDDHFNCLAPFICEHKKSYVNALVNFRNKSDKNFYVSNWWTNGRDQMAYSRGNLGFVLINNSTDNIHQTFQTGLLAGSYCNLMDVNCSNTIVVNQAGLASINLAKMSALVLQF